MLLLRSDRTPKSNERARGLPIEAACREFSRRQKFASPIRHSSSFFLFSIGRSSSTVVCCLNRQLFHSFDLLPSYLFLCQHYQSSGSNDNKDREKRTDRTALGASVCFSSSSIFLLSLSRASQVSNRLTKQTNDHDCKRNMHMTLFSCPPRFLSLSVKSTIDASSSLPVDICNQPGYDDGGKSRWNCSSSSSRSSRIKIRRRENSPIRLLLHLYRETLSLSAARMPMREEENQIHLRALQR